MEQATGETWLEVRDNGVRFAPTLAYPGRLRLHSMRERAARLGGTFQLESTPGAGTRICVRLPGRI